MTLTYTNITSEGCIAGSDEIEEFGEDFEYEVDSDEVRQVLSDHIYNEEFKHLFVNEDKNLKKLIVGAIDSLIQNFDLQDKLETDCYDIIKEHFEKEAFASMEE